MLNKKLLYLLLFLGANQFLEYEIVRYYPNLLNQPRFFSFVPLWVAWLAGLLVLLVLWAYFYKKKPPTGWWWLLAGFTSNLLTYSLRGSFVDYIPTGISYFNISDLVILSGIALLSFRSRNLFDDSL